MGWGGATDSGLVSSVGADTRQILRRFDNLFGTGRCGRGRGRLPRRGAVYYMEWDTGIYSAPDQPRDPRCERTGRRDAGGKCMQIDAVVISSCDTIYTRD
jgi:hypothetical protein